MDDIRARIRLLSLQILGILIDSAFVALWVIVHAWFEEHVATQFRLDGVHAYTFNAFQGVFAVGTFFPVAAYVVVDLYSIYKRTQKALVAVGEQQ